jgi:molecular chaperone GrpE
MDDIRTVDDDAHETPAALVDSADSVASLTHRQPDALDQLVERLMAVEAQVGEFHRRAAHREAIIDRLHAENQELRAGLRRSILEPAVADLIRLHDELLRQASRLTGDVAELVRSFAGDIEITLNRCGLEAFTAIPGAAYVHGEHRPVAVIPTDDPAFDNAVADVVAVGFRERDSGRVRRPLHARFYQYQPPPAERNADVLADEHSQEER